MEEVVATDDISYETRDKFAKLMLGTAAGFVAMKLVENLYDNIVVARRNK